MAMKKSLDCVVIGYNEIPFQRYESFLKNYGADSEAYRDLRFSFVDLGGQKLDYLGLLNHVTELASPARPDQSAAQQFKSGDIPNLAAIYLTNYLRKRGCHAEYINLYQYEQEKLIDYLKQEPLCIAITTTFYVVNQPVNEMVEFIRTHNSKVKIVVGGPLISNHARNPHSEGFRSALDDMGADIYVIEGQGELTLLQIVESLRDGADLSLVPNIVYFENGEMRRTKVLAENNSLDENYVDWLSFPEMELGKTLQTRTARSCAFKCSFCNYPTRAGALTLTSLDVLEKELDSMVELGNVENVVFIDDTFNVPFPRFKDICRMMIRKRYPFKWFSYFRCSNSDEEAIDLMAESGCQGVFLGIESGSPTILSNMNKAATIEKYTAGIEMLRQRRIMTFGSFIIGFPGETESTVQETIDFIQATKPDYYRAQMWYCEPGTQYQISGEGFVWSHATMDSLEAMDHIDRLFLTTNESIWLPQWSFDFWTIPYLLGRGISLSRFKDFMMFADRMLRLEIASVSDRQKSSTQVEQLQKIVELVKDWGPVRYSVADRSSAEAA
ncbi:MAG: PhpK family radical SAM P-methyltransferase [Acidobacteria bacterium]|nr:MAG: PhpK family radical SAM P-methyltransferase [Acidobacteriota bacterium]